MRYYIFFIVILLLNSFLLPIHSYNDNSSEIAYLLKSINNENIRFGTYRSEKSNLIISDRKIIILGPDEALKILKIGNKVIPELVRLLNDNKRDWAAHLILTSLTRNCGAMYSMTIIYMDDYKEWRKKAKKICVIHWKKLLKNTKKNYTSDWVG